MAEGYQKHLAKLHAKQTVQAELLDDILGEVSSAPVLAKQRIIAGESNEVYDIAFADGLQVIVRISRYQDKSFESEQWAILECARRSVPVPEMLGIWHRSTSNQPLHICIERKLKGELLSNATFPHHEMRQIVVQVGEFLSRIHTIPINGVGYINGKGEGAFLSPEGEIDALVHMEAEFQALAKRLDLSSRDMARALQLVVEEEKRVAQSIVPCLTHNDFSAKHSLVANGEISGIIDFGEAAGSEPLSDLVRWHYYDAARFPFEWLQEGYTNKQIFDEQFTLRLHIKRIGFSLWVMRWYDRHGYAAGVADARTKFVHDLGQLEQSVSL